MICKKSINKSLVIIGLITMALAIGQLTIRLLGPDNVTENLETGYIEKKLILPSGTSEEVLDEVDRS